LQKEKEKEKEKEVNISRADGCLQLSTVISCQLGCNHGFKHWQTETDTKERERKIRP
jgi:hypothetical protein